MTNKPSNTKFFTQIVDLLQSARSKIVRTVNQTMVLTYFEIGRMIVEEEQGGKERADYGKKVIKELSKVLTNEFGKGFSDRNIEQMRQFYLVYSKPQTPSADFKGISQTSSAESENAISITSSRNFNLSWSHYLKLMRIDDENERKFYEIESSKNNWSVRELQRQFDAALYTRLVLSRDKEKVKELSEKGLVFEKPKDAIKDPYILEFIGLPEHSSFSESDLEQELIDKLEHFLLELGNGFTFVARQKRISFDDKHFRIDLVFYNRILKCFVLIDLKIGEIKHQDLGQMQMYANYYDKEVRLEDENKTIGIVLCKDKNESVVEYTLPENNEQIFASKYQTVLPSKEELKLLINERESQR
ncbi:PDDEXK nuclease domain-containing protein [Arenibacter sp. GZD96]|uniref:PDDEXK nuclease domain-containing protein n=1 Tax=Aurantibrevibacter litoralis TaxID=3106030 RepID=UPI002AFFFC53|nr:PDDEXK nuclease domain-containing protein [Arenibacter sp. GZD-96]MEA1786858.1 PDDEXK nuclease domain-containing protein [Arenibacter sp. GZD-96]